jgi:alkylhydroperoxidase family enzyme
MPNITMLDIEALKQTKLRPYIEKCLANRAPDPGFHAMMGHNIDLAEAMFVAWDTVFNTGRVSHKLKEIIRVQLSRMASCVYWGNVRSASAKRQGLQEDDIDEGIAHYDTSDRFSPAEKLALRYSELMALNPDRIDAAFSDELRRHYTDEEIIELGAFIGFNIGYHTFFGTLKFYPMFSPDGQLVSQEESARIYGAAPRSLAE